MNRKQIQHKLDIAIMKVDDSQLELIQIRQAIIDEKLDTTDSGQNLIKWLDAILILAEQLRTLLQDGKGVV